MFELCFVVSVVLVLCGIGWAIFAHVGWRRLGLLVFLLLADIALVYPVSLAEYSYDPLLGALQIPYNLLAMFLFESRIETFYTLFSESSVAFGNMYFALLQLLYVASFAILTVLAYGLATKKFSRILLKWKVLWFRILHPSGRLYIFNGMDNRPRVFLEDLFSINQASQRGAARRGSKGKRKDRLCIVVGMSKDALDVNSTLKEEFRGMPVVFSEMSILAFSDLLLKSPFFKSCLMAISSTHFFFFGGEKGVNLSQEGKNLSEAIVLLERLGTAFGDDECYGEDGRPLLHVYIACSGRSDELLLDSVEELDLDSDANLAKGIDVRVIDEGREISHTLLWRYPLTEAFINKETREPFSVADRRDLLDRARRVELDECKANELKDKDAPEGLRPLVVVIVGMGHYGFEIFKSVSWMGQIPGSRLKIYAIDSRPVKDVQDLVDFLCPDLLYPLEECGFASEDGCLVQRRGALLDVAFMSADVRAPRFREVLQREIVDVYKKSSAAPYVVVALGDEDLNIDTAVLVRQQFYRDEADSDEAPTCIPQIFIDVYDERRHKSVEALRAYNGPDARFKFIPFGGISHIFNEAYIVDSDFEALAFNVNASYNYVFADPDYAPTYRDLFASYAKFQMNRLSSTTSALSVRTKLWVLGFDIDPGQGSESGFGELRNAMANQLGKYVLGAGRQHMPLIEILARNEHNRWRAFYCTEGWSGMSAAQSNTLKAHGLTDGRHDSHLLMLHPYMCDFDDLVETAKNVGKVDKDGNGKDPTVYDLNMITDLPDILSDAAGLTGKKFYVRKVAGR